MTPSPSHPLQPHETQGNSANAASSTWTSLSSTQEPSLKIHRSTQICWSYSIHSQISEKNPHPVSLRIKALLTSSGNGYRRVAEVWAFLTQREDSSGMLRKVVLKQTFPFSALKVQPSLDLKGSSTNLGEIQTLELGSCRFTAERICGKLQYNGKTLEFDFQGDSPLPWGPNWWPKSSRWVGSRPYFFSTSPDLASAGGKGSGWVRYLDSPQDSQDLQNSKPLSPLANGEKISLESCSWEANLLSGRDLGEGYAWLSATLSQDTLEERPSSEASGAATPPSSSSIAQIRALLFYPSTSAGPQSWVGPGQLPLFEVKYLGQVYVAKGLWSAWRSKNEQDLTGWRWRVDQGELSFRCEGSTEVKDLSGFTQEDSEGGLLFGATTAHARVQLGVYRKDKLEALFQSKKGALWETLSRRKSPYIASYT